jgi:cubilin
MSVLANFSALAISGEPPECIPGDYVEIFNGESVSSPSLGKFCGTQVPPAITSSSNRLTLQFVSDRDGQASTGFHLFFSQVSRECGGNIELTYEVPTAEISSPNYPQEYPLSTDCSWVLRAPANKRVRFSFVGDFSLESHPGCQYDYVELRDGATVSSPLIEKRFCGAVRPNSILLSSGAVMFVRFHTDDSRSEAGFKAVIGYALCGGTVSGANGTLSSPNYPEQYPNDAYCEWFVEAPRGHYIEFTLTDLRLESNVNCSAGDFLEIRDVNSTGTQLLMACGVDIPLGTITTSDSFAYVRFQSNGQNTNNGFRLSFASSVEECGGTLTSDTGVIKSPNYPGYYAHRRRCHWVIRVQKSRKITLTFEDIDIESLFQRITPMCTGDFIQVLNGYLPQSPEIGRFCSKVLPGPIESSANVMSVMFQSETGLAGRGFKATYTSDKMADCGFTLCPVSETIIESPGFSDNSSYNASQQCIWTISCPSLPAESTMVIRFLALDLERHGECIYDFVELREGDDENGVLMGRYCHLADQPLPLILSPSPSMWIRFVSDYSDAGRGFQLSSSIAACGGVLTEDHGTIVNPVASERMDCAWVITAPIGSQIKLTFTTLSLPYEVNCTKSYIEVINGYLVSAPSAGKFCQLPVNTFRSQSHQIRLLYHSDVAVQTPNTFVIRYDFETQGCGGMYQAQRGFIMSPNYPSNYNNSIECIWDITVQNGYHIRWAFNDQFQIDDADGCASDNVQIVEVGPNGETVGVPSRYCGSIQPPPGISYGNKIQVKFRSNDIFGGRGFLMNFTAECGAVYNGTEGTIVSPGFPDNYDNNLNCTYEITGNPQKHTILRFTPGRFFIRDHPPHTSFLSGIDRFEPAVYECSRDYLEIFALGNGTEPPQKLRRLCGRMAPPVLSTLGGIRINFVTDSANTDRGWSIQFQLADCGGTLTEPEGTIQSVLYPDSYHDNANCTWVITVPDNKLIKLQFEKFSLEPHPRCEFDYVAIYNGLTINPDNLQQQYCGDRVPPVFLSTGSNIVVNFVTDTSRTGEGFVAQYESVYGPAHGCGGTVRIDAGMNATIRSPDIDGDGVYDDELDCVWQIDVPENYVAHVQFMELQLEVGPTSCVDYLEIHDGRTVMDPLIGSQYCNQPAVPFNISSSSNALFLRMYTDVSIGDSGFRAIVVAVPRACGGVLTSRPTPTPLTYQARQSNERCRWIIEAPADEQVEINVTMVNIDELSLCAKDYLELRDHQLLDPHSPVVLCQRRIPQLFISSGRTAQVNFVIGSDRNVPSRSFSLTYKTASCNRILTSNSSRVVSPRWPSTYPINANCEVKIITPAGYKLAIFFAVFELEQHENCAYDYLAIYNSTVVAAESLVPPSPLCGRTVPDPIFLNTNTALLKFVTDGSLTHAGYDITYLASPDGCGGQLWDVNGTFTSPGYPQTVSTTVKCHWLISVPQQRHVNLLLTILPSLSTLPPSADCTSSFVSVYDSLSLDPERLRGTFCTAESIAVMTSSSNNMLVVYSSNATSVNIAFRAVYWSTIATGALPIIPSSRSEDYGYDLYD